MVTDFLFGFRTLTLNYADLTLSHCNIDLLFVNLVNLVSGEHLINGMKILKMSYHGRIFSDFSFCNPNFTLLDEFFLNDHLAGSLRMAQDTIEVLKILLSKKALIRAQL